MTEPLPGITSQGIRNSPTPALAGAPTPRGPELVFHDPFANSVAGQRADAPDGPLMPVRSSPGPDPAEPKRLKRRWPATRAEAIEAVSRDLDLLLQRSGNSAGS